MDEEVYHIIVRSCYIHIIEDEINTRPLPLSGDRQGDIIAEQVTCKMPVAKVHGSKVLH